MKRNNDDTAIDSFFYNAGLVARGRYPKATGEFKKRFIDGFKRFVDSRGGPEFFASASDAIEKFCQNQVRRGGRRAR